jgi:hypothetical protein
MTDKMIKNENWYVKNLASKISNGEIYKPKYQRKRKWDLTPKKENVPSEKKYIEFLFDTYNSVHAITFGQDGDKLSNIDGNNRINAIIHFLNEPFIIFPERLSGLTKLLTEKISQEIALEVEKIMKKIKYDELMVFKYNKYFIEKGFKELYNKHLKETEIRDDVEPLFDELINSMKINNKDRFDNDVKINVNLFSGYTTEELAEVFGRINQYNSVLTEQEALASRLFNIYNFKIHDKLLEYQIKQHIKKYYNERINDEILDCYTYNEETDIMNAYDFMVGFQNYSNSQCGLIHKTDNDGLSLFFKIFKNINKGGSFDKTFTTENVNKFINYINNATIILKKIQSAIFMENLVGGSSKIFDTANKKLNSLKKNNMYLLITTIIGYINNKTPDDEILKSIEKSILYHFFVNNLDDKEKRDQYKLNDGIVYEAGGSFIDNKAKEYYRTPTLLSNKITEEIMTILLKDLIAENIKNRQYEVRENGKDKYDKRRQRKTFEKVIIYYYYICNVPTQFLNNNFWIEHIFPFSCSWDNEIDIDRLGNIFPILESLNRERSNKHISEYKKTDKNKFLTYIDIIPNNEMYDEIVSHKNKKPHIYESKNFNNFCSNNENIIISNFLQKLFS